MANTHSARLERWLGVEQVENISKKMVGWHGPPIPVANVPGRVFACGDGDFCGPIKGGYVGNLFEYASHKIAKAIRKLSRRELMGAGFASLSDLISEATAGNKMQKLLVGKTGATGVAATANSLWEVGSIPEAGSAATATPAGHSPTHATAGALYYEQPTGGDTCHFVGATIVSSAAGHCLLMYDRFFAVNHNLASTQSPAVSGTPTRYQDATAAGNFITVFVTTALGTSLGNYSIGYVDESGNSATTAAQALVASSIVRRFPFTIGNGWFLPLASGDRGVRAITQITRSVGTGTGIVDVVLAKPYVWIPSPIANAGVIVDGINSAFNLVKITDASCLAFMELKNSTAPTNYSGEIILVSG